jgi:hypothetical protein
LRPLFLYILGKSLFLETLYISFLSCPQFLLYIQKKIVVVERTFFLYTLSKSLFLETVCISKLQATDLHWVEISCLVLICIPKIASISKQNYVRYKFLRVLRCLYQDPGVLSRVEKTIASLQRG